MIIRILELRDRATFIPIVAILLHGLGHSPENEKQRYLLRRAGYSCEADDSMILLMRAEGNSKACCDPYDWGSGNRTFAVAHKWLMEHFNETSDGDVVDVEFILGETLKPKPSEREEL